MKWIKLDCDTQENLDMRNLIDVWGWDWYGRYWAICGKIGMLVTEKQQTFALQTSNGSPFSIKLLANDLGTNVERLTNFCQFLADNNLIDNKSWYSKSLIYIPELKKRADEYTKKLLTKSRQSADQEEDIEVDKEREVEKETTTTTVAVDYSSVDSSPAGYCLEQHLLDWWGREGKCAPAVLKAFCKLAREYSWEKLFEAIEIAGKANIKKLSYVQGILNPIPKKLNNDHSWLERKLKEQAEEERLANNAVE